MNYIETGLLARKLVMERILHKSFLHVQQCMGALFPDPKMPINHRYQGRNDLVLCSNVTTVRVI